LEILECLGRGGMGVVYKARQPKLNREVALKLLAPEKGDDSRFTERFEREAQALARLNHPNIVAIHDFGQTEGFYYLLMEYVDGANLRQLLRAGNLAPEQALAIVPRICDALQFAHDKGVVHRDIKPENVLLDKEGQVKITDFGIAKIVSLEAGQRSLTQDEQVMGTPHYMAPEQIETPAHVDHRADIYSLGVVFYEMLTGELPLGKFAPPSRKVQVDVRLDEVVLHALEKEPDRRYQHASEVKTDVEDIAGSAGTKSGAATSASPPGQPPPASRTSPPSVIGTRFTLGYSVVGAFALAECGLIVLGVVTNAVHWLVVAAAAGGVWGIATMFCTAHALDKRGIRINYPLLGLMMILEYLPRYRALTLQETGRVGPLFYSYIVAMNLALVAVVLAWIVTRW
jgi:serine/threonine protein kinase